MEINAVKLIYFSPTQTTKKVLEGIAEGMQMEWVEHIDLTRLDATTQDPEALDAGLVIMGVPVYGGRVPVEAVERLQPFRGEDTPVVCVVLYGNREYEDALLELMELAEKAGFKPVAGGAFIGEHSFADDNVKIANGRPDNEDLNKAREFGGKIRKKLGEIQTLDDISPLRVPGNTPYKERRERSGISPVTQDTLCELCETCASVCPNAAITIDERILTDPEACILCCACVKNCPTGARVMEDSRIKQMAEWLRTNCSERKEPEMYV